ncbi:hypothetical protein GMRT_14904 [Giardia muris]|uniref:Uncharacterized protein n=1 Tax=Giardia muris TaxID=5742 RepID=A0A4Z1SMS1_GIAMU|nr:hypothetical protein GMRT_14904 [Giardia muris]|eukprot:TNJ27012.1 hypothetical protein GMRT_14904 [Giardia muris]
MDFEQQEYHEPEPSHIQVYIPSVGQRPTDPTYSTNRNSFAKQTCKFQEFPTPPALESSDFCCFPSVLGVKDDVIAWEAPQFHVCSRETLKHKYSFPLVDDIECRIGGNTPLVTSFVQVGAWLFYTTSSTLYVVWLNQGSNRVHCSLLTADFCPLHGLQVTHLQTGDLCIAVAAGYGISLTDPVVTTWNDTRRTRIHTSTILYVITLSSVEVDDLGQVLRSGKDEVTSFIPSEIHKFGIDGPIYGVTAVGTPFPVNERREPNLIHKHDFHTIFQLSDTDPAYSFEARDWGLYKVAIGSDLGPIPCIMVILFAVPLTLNAQKALNAGLLTESVTLFLTLDKDDLQYYLSQVGTLNAPIIPTVHDVRRTIRGLCLSKDGNILCCEHSRDQPTELSILTLDVSLTTLAKHICKSMPIKQHVTQIPVVYSRSLGREGVGHREVSHIESDWDERDGKHYFSICITEYTDTFEVLTRHLVWLQVQVDVSNSFLEVSAEHVRFPPGPTITGGTGATALFTYETNTRKERTILGSWSKKRRLIRMVVQSSGQRAEHDPTRSSSHKHKSLPSRTRPQSLGQHLPRGNRPPRDNRGLAQR